MVCQSRRTYIANIKVCSIPGLALSLFVIPRQTKKLSWPIDIEQQQFYQLHNHISLYKNTSHAYADDS